MLSPQRSLSVLVLVVLVLSVLALGPWCRTAHAEGIAELAARAMPSVVHLSIRDATGREAAIGSGFFVSSDGRIVTNHHVVKDAAAVSAKLQDGRTIEVVGILAEDVENDVAVLQASGSGFVALELGSSAGLRPGDEVVIIGSPAGFRGTLSLGIVSAIREEGVENLADGKPIPRSWVIQTNAAISQGSSGSPILTGDGKVVAVAVGLVTVGHSLNFGVRIERVQDLLSGLAPGAQPTSFARIATGRSLTTNLLISLIFFGLIGLAWWASGRPPSARRSSRKTLA